MSFFEKMKNAASTVATVGAAVVTGVSLYDLVKERTSKRERVAKPRAQAGAPPKTQPARKPIVVDIPAVEVPPSEEVDLSDDDTTEK